MLRIRYSTWLRAGRSGIESRWERDFPPVQTGPGAHPASCKMGTGSSPGLKCGRGVLLTTHPLLVPRSWEEYSYTSTHPLGHAGPVTGWLYLLFSLLVYIMNRISLHFTAFCTHVVAVIKWVNVYKTVHHSFGTEVPKYPHWLQKYLNSCYICITLWIIIFIRELKSYPSCSFQGGY